MKEDVKLCETCGIKPTISPNSPYCASCMAKRANASKQAKKKTAEKEDKVHREPKGKNATLDTPNTEKPSPRGDLEVVIDFGKYENILREVKELAEDEMRPIDLQVIYMLKTHLNSTQEGQTT